MGQYVKITGLFVLTVLFFAACKALPVKPKTFRIEIREWGSFANGDDTWIITNDSVLSIQTGWQSSNNPAKADTLRIKLDSKQKERIGDALSLIDLNKIQKRNVNDSAPDDLREFDFKITLNGQTKEFWVYQTKVMHFLI